MNALYMIRHSITEGNARRLYYGATDLPLTEAGRALCRSLRGAYALPAEITYATSGMLRTEETLSLLFGDVDHEMLPDLREMEMGVFEMHSYDELKDTAEYQAWLTDTEGNYRIPGGESNREMAQRVCSCVQALGRRPGPDLLVVCHGGVIAHAMNDCFPTPGKSFYHWIPESCHGFAIFFQDGEAVSYKPI